MTEKKKLLFPNYDSLQQVVNVVNEATQALNDKSRTIKESTIPAVLAGALGAGVGGAISFAALYSLGLTGLSAAGIMSGLAVAGGAASVAVGGAVSASVAGLFVLALPVAGLAAGGVGIATHFKSKQLKQEKERLYKEAVKKHQSIIQALKDEVSATEERANYLMSINILLQQAINDLKKDLGVA